jgi:YVTN family beta-propeller protein
MYFNIPDYPNPTFPVAKHLDITTPIDPGKKDLYKALTRGYSTVVHPVQGQTTQDDSFDEDTFDDGEAVPVYITYTGAIIENGFTYLLTNNGNDPLVPSLGDDFEIDADNPPVLYISFLFGSEDYEITTQALGDNNITMDANAKLPWLPQQHAAGTAYWSFTPQNPQIIAPHDTVKFPINKIITELDVDPDAISVMYIQLNNIPGYNDAAFTLPLQKLRAEATAVSFECVPKEINLNDNVKLTWVSSLASRVTIEYKTRDNVLITLDSAAGQIKLNGTDFVPPIAPNAEKTTFKFITYRGPDPGTSIDRELTVIQEKAQITKFEAIPQLADVTQPATITFNWATTNAQKITLTTPDGVIPVTDKGGTTTYPLTKTALFTLNAYSYGSAFPDPTTQSLRVFAYKPVAPIPVAIGGIGMQTFPSILVNNKYKRLYVLDVSAKAFYDIDITNPTSGNKPPGAVMALSQDESKLFLYNDDVSNWGVYMIDVASNAQSPKYGFGAVYQMIVTPDLKNLYCAWTFHQNYVTQLAVNAGGNTMTIGAQIEVGKSPRAMAFNADATKLYVACYEENIVTVIKVSDNTIITKITLGTTEPTTFAFRKAANKLYLTCEGDHFVAVIDTVGDTLIKLIPVKKRPSNIILNPSRPFAYVANFGNNSVSVINTDDDVEVATLPVGTGPLGMGLNADSNVLFVSNYCDRTLSVIDINSNTVLPQTLSTGSTNGNPIDMAIYTNVGDYTGIYVAKENFPPRIDCANPGNTALEVSVFSIQKP